MTQTHAGRIWSRPPSALSDAVQSVPGVGPSIAHDLHELGIHRVKDLVGKDPERLYRRLEMLRRQDQDRCLLYVFRCAVYFAGTPRPDPEKLKWWNWKDAKLKRA